MHFHIGNKQQKKKKSQEKNIYAVNKNLGKV